MKFFALLLSTALFGAALAGPNDGLNARTSCQVGDIWGAGDAACSASCIAQDQGFHGGHCNDEQVCICNY